MKIKKIFIILLIILTFSMVTVCADEIESEINNQTEEQETEINKDNHETQQEIVTNTEDTENQQNSTQPQEEVEEHKTQPQTKDRNSSNNLGVNKKWKITSSNESNVLSTKYVDADEKIYDFSGVLTEDEVEKLKEQAKEFKKKTKMEIIILIDNVPYTYDSKNEDFAADFYDYNDFGLDLDDNYSGVLLFRNTYEQDPYYNIYTFGKAQLYFSYNRLENTLDDIYDNIHNGNYYSGFSYFISKMTTYYDSGIPSEMKGYKLDETGHLKKTYRPPIFIAFLISLVTSSVIVFILIMKNKMVRKATKAEEYLDKNSINITNKQDQFITSRTTHYTTSSSSGSSGGGFSSSSGSSGGGHSSGGGRHG